MRTLYLILLIVAAVLFGLAALISAKPVTTDTTTTVTITRVNLVALGLLAWVLVPLIQTADRLGD